MSFREWVNNSATSINKNGLEGVRSSLVELWYGIRSRARRIHWLTPNSRTITIDNISVEIQQKYVGEFDQIRAHHNESWMAHDLIEELHTDDCFWDVGGNIGIYSLLAAELGSNVVVFEPWLENAATIERNLHQNGHSARVIPKALADECGPHEFTLDERQTPGAGRGSLLDSWQDGEKRTIECVRGDVEYNRNDLPAPTVIKIDVEGAELDVLEGLGDLLQNIRVIYCELHGINDDEVRNLLRSEGFNIEADLDETKSGIIRARS